MDLHVPRDLRVSIGPRVSRGWWHPAGGPVYDVTFDEFQ